MPNISYLLSSSSHVWLHLMQEALGSLPAVLKQSETSKLQKGKVHLAPAVCYCYNPCARNSNQKQDGPKNDSWNLSQKKWTKQLLSNWPVPSFGLLDSHSSTSCNTGGSKELEGSQDCSFQQQPTPRLTCHAHQEPHSYPDFYSMKTLQEGGTLPMFYNAGTLKHQ